MSPASTAEREPCVEVDEDGDGVVTLHLDNPPVNAMADGLLDSLGEALERVDRSQAARAVVLTGRGSKAFAAGADLPGLRAAMDDESEMERHTTRTRRVLTRLATMRQPVIAALDASAVGGGLELVLACDLAIAAAGSRLGLPEVGLGLIPGAGGTQRLTRRIGALAATELILTGRLVTAEEAHRLGLISAVAKPGKALEDACSLARRLADQPAVAVQEALRVIRSGLALPLEEALDLERAAFIGVLRTPDACEGVDAFIERRRPRFTHASLAGGGTEQRA